MKTCKLFAPTKNSPPVFSLPTAGREGRIGREMRSISLPIGVVGSRRVFTTSPSLRSGTPPKNRRRAFSGSLLSTKNVPLGHGPV